MENGELQKKTATASATINSVTTATSGATRANGTLRKGFNSPFSILTSQLAAACAATADELAASRTLIDALEKENVSLKARHQSDQQMIDVLTELNETRRSETDALRSAVAAKNEALTAKDAVIASQDKLIETLKRKKSSPWKRLGDVLTGVGIGIVL
jgi:chromosome segregation ATPase